MRIVRFTPGPESGLGADPLFGVLEDDNSITIISGDPIYHGVTKTAAKVELSKVRLLAPVIPRSKIVAVGKNYADHAKEMGSDVPKERVHEVIFGYTLANDVTCRELQRSDGQWARAKGFDTFCPIGPWIETDFVPGTQRIFSKVNDELRQDATLDQMIFSIEDIVVFVSQVMTLLPGDVIITGTPAGIGPLIERGNVVVSVEGLGQLTNKVSAKP